MGCRLVPGLPVAAYRFNSMAKVSTIFSNSVGLMLTPAGRQKRLLACRCVGPKILGCPVLEGFFGDAISGEQFMQLPFADTGCLCCGVDPTPILCQ